MDNLINSTIDKLNNKINEETKRDIANQIKNITMQMVEKDMKEFKKQLNDRSFGGSNPASFLYSLFNLSYK